jgi:hypothetical protein
MAAAAVAAAAANDKLLLLPPRCDINEQRPCNRYIHQLFFAIFHSDVITSFRSIKYHRTCF